MRIKHLAIAASCLFLFLGTNLFYLQIIRGNYYWILSERNRIRLIYLEGPRGRILDRRGTVLVENRISYNCMISPDEARGRLSETFKRLAPALQVSPNKLQQIYLKNEINNFQPVLVAEGITPHLAMTIEEMAVELPGVSIETRPIRYYPQGDTFSHLVGYVGPLTEEEVDRLRDFGYDRRDGIGRSGIEKTYESYLKGESGGLQVEADNRGRQVRLLGMRDPKPGRDIQLSVDADLQEFIYSKMGSLRGAVVVLDLKTGDVLALVSSPGFDPNLFRQSNQGFKIRDLLRQKDAPLLNRAISGAYPPGSTFKVVTSTAALESHKITPLTTFECGGLFSLGSQKFHCWREEGHGPQSVVHALEHSCNVFFYHTGLVTGADKIAEWTWQFGLGKLTGIDLAGERKGFVPSPEWKKRVLRENWYSGETLNLAIGQGRLLTTPLQMAMVISMIANGGVVYTPQIVKKIGEVQVNRLKPKKIYISDETLTVVRRGLKAVVNSPTGTGMRAQQTGFLVAGKTGTAQAGPKGSHAWFIGYAPADDPHAALVVFLEHGGRGGVRAAEIGGLIFKHLRESGLL